MIDSKGQRKKITEGYKGQQVVENHDHSLPEKENFHPINLPYYDTLSKYRNKIENNTKCKKKDIKKKKTELQKEGKREKRIRMKN